MGPGLTFWVITLVLWTAGWVVLGRLRRLESVTSDAGDGLARVSVIIPARNEEHNLPALLGSLGGQRCRPAEILVVDDASTDRTAAVAAAQGARVIPSRPLPDGWRGKTWACHQGARAARGEWLLFLDADTWFEADGLDRVLAHTTGDNRVLSLGPYHRVRRFHEQFSAFFNLIMLAGTGAFSCLGDRVPPRGLLGQFLLIHRLAYEEVGGHECVKDRILENFWLAERLRAANVPLRCRTGQGAFSFRMYPNGWRELVEGWSKGFASGAGQTPPAPLLLVVAWMTGLMLAPIGWVLAGWGWLGGLIYGLCGAQVWWMLRRVGSFHWGVALLYPVPLCFFFSVFARSAWLAKRRRDVVWKGRHIRAG